MATALTSQAANTPHVARKAAAKIYIDQQTPECFQTDQRYFCKTRCPWSHRCKKLIAEWLR